MWLRIKSTWCDILHMHFKSIDVFAAVLWWPHSALVVWHTRLNIYGCHIIPSPKCHQWLSLEWVHNVIRLGLTLQKDQRQTKIYFFCSFFSWFIQPKRRTRYGKLFYGLWRGKIKLNWCDLRTTGQVQMKLWVLTEQVWSCAIKVRQSQLFIIPELWWNFLSDHKTS